MPVMRSLLIPDDYSFSGEVNGGKRKFKLITNLGTLAYSDASI